MLLVDRSLLWIPIASGLAIEQYINADWIGWQPGRRICPAKRDARRFPNLATKLAMLITRLDRASGLAAPVWFTHASLSSRIFRTVLPMDFCHVSAPRDALHERVVVDRLGPIDPIETIYHSEARHLRRYFRRKTGGHEDAADLVQDAFMKLAATRTADIANPAAYLQRIARNLVADWFRSRRAQTYCETVPLDECDCSVPACQEDLYLFERAVAGMSQKTRAVFLFKRVEGLTYEQIGKKLGISVKTVEYHMRQALVHISRFLEEK